MGGVSSVLNPGAQPAVSIPDGYETPPFPSLYDPNVQDTFGNEGHFLYQAYTIWRFQFYWNLILFGTILFLCSIACFTTSLLSLTILRRPPPEPKDAREKMRRPRKPFPLWPVFLIPVVWSALGALVALICSAAVGFVLAAVYNAAGFSMSTWVPFLWAWIQVLILIISLQDEADLPGVTRLLLPYCSLKTSSILYLSVVYALHCSPAYTYLQVTQNTGRQLLSILDDRFMLLQSGFQDLDDGGADTFCPHPHNQRWSFLSYSTITILLLSGVMGKLIYHQWGRLLALTSATYMLSASMWAFFYRKFFWDVIGGTLGPAGIIPGANSRPFVAIIVDIPLLQIFTLLLSTLALVIELPAPFIKGTAIHRSLALRVVLYLVAGFIGILVYQTFDCAVYLFITSIVYAKAMLKGEIVDAQAKEIDVV